MAADAAAGKAGGGDDLLFPNGDNVKNRQPLGLAGEIAEETSDVSASLFKEISSEEEMEVLSATPHVTGMGGDVLSMKAVGNAGDSEQETSGEDGSLFEEIGGDDSHFGGLGGVQQSAYDRAANGDGGAAAGYILGGSLRFQTEDVPFIRAARGDLDGPLDGPLVSLRREDGTSLHTFGEKLNSIFEDLRAKEESSLGGICRDYSSSSGEEGGVHGVNVILTDSDRHGGHDSVPLKGQGGRTEHVQETVEVLMIPMDQGNDVKIVSGIMLAENPEVSILPLTIEGHNPTTLDLDASEVADGGVPKVISSSPKEAPKKRGRASRELGALLLDVKGNGRGRKAAGLKADVSDSFALAVVRGTAEGGGTVDGVVVEPSEGLGARLEVRITRSRASGRQAGKNENLDGNTLDGTGSQDVMAKRTGKRSVARAGRLGWGNGLENSADGGLVAGESSILPDKVSAEGQTGVGLETGQGVENKSDESNKGPESKVRNARGKGKQVSSDGGSGQLTGFNSHIEESHTAGITTDITKGLKGLETQSQIHEVLITPPSAGSLTNFEAQETEAVEPANALESNSGGRRRSNRQKAKIGVQIEAEQHGLVGQSKRKQQRKSAVIANELPQIPAGSQQANQEIGSSEEVAGQLRLSEQNVSRNVGDDVGPLDSSKGGRGKGRKTAKGKSTTRKAPQKRGKKNLEISETLEGPSSDVLGGELVPSGTNTNATLSLENKESTGEAETGKEKSVNAPNGASNDSEKIGEESCVDRSESDSRLPLNEQCGGFAEPSGQLEDKISPVKVSGPGNDVDFELVPDREPIRQHTTEEGGSELIKGTISEKLETCGSSPVGELAKVLQVNSQAEVDVRDAVYIESPGVNEAVDCEAGGSSDVAVHSEKCLTIVDESCNTNSWARGEAMGSAKDHDSATKKAGGVEQKSTELRFAEAVPNARNEGIEEMDHKVAVKKPSDGKAGRVGKNKPSGGRKGAATRKPKVDNSQGSEAGVKPKGRARKTVTAKKTPAKEAGPSTTREDSVVEAKKKASAAQRKRKRKLNSDNVVGSVAPSQDSVEPSKDIVVDDMKEPADGNKDVMEMPEMDGKSRLKGKSTAGGLDGGAAKKRRKTGKLEGTQLDSDPCSVAMAVNASSEGRTEGLPIGSGSELKAPQRGKAGQKKSQKAISGKKVAKKTPVGDKSKQPKKPPRTAAKAKGATVKVLSNIKDQSGQERTPPTKNKSVKPKIGKSKSKLQLELTDHCALDDGEAGREEKGEAAVGSVSSNQETDGNVTKAMQSEEVVRDVDGGVAGEDVSSGVTEGGENKGSEKGIDSAGAETGAPRKSWVLCDDCNKWRCIPVDLADQIESTNARWSCRENPDKEFQDCSVPQEKSNAEINAELQISEVSVCEEGDDKDAVDSKSMNLGAANEENKPAVWKRIRRNIFQHRRRKVLEIDEMMVCQCTPPEDGGVGCGENCLNRMLSIECVAEQCPCGEACTNQQFQNRTYAPISMYRCGKKGFGLRVVEDVPKGTFIIEYVGEVLDVSAFEARQQDYARNGQKHFYFMTLNTNEVIDACSKGNYGRFINHSCEPNCRTDKWMVNGEVCIGLFAVRDIAKDEEVTFDYNYVRVCGAAAKKCECGSSQCRGFIGGDPLTPKAVVESDSEDEEDLEPIMVENSEDEDAYVDENKLAPCKKPRAEAEFQDTPPVRTVGIKRKLNIMKEKALPVVKRLKTSGSARKSNSMNYKGLTLDISGGRHDGPRTISFSDVQEKLDDMLDRNGGLRKRRDAAKQYLRLLVLTSASGDSRKDATACSVRDLSLLLEALLKTTSRTVLSDIINKNGLRMLHNLIKQLRRQWDKTPILRKLIKVLDLLASERVLTTDLITSGPPCNGMESFSESLFDLTRHKDTEVVQMVRRFRNRWMPPRIWDQHYSRHDKPFPMQSMHSMQSSSAAVTHQSEQQNVGSNLFQSPQHPKQVSLGSELSRPGSSEPSRSQGGNLPTSQSHNGLTCMEGATVKEDVKSTVKVSEVGKDFTPGMTQPAEKKTRKRPSRWDAPAKVEKTSKGPSAGTNQSDSQGVDSGKQTTFPVPQVSQGSVQALFEGSRQIANQAPSTAAQGLKQAAVPPVAQSWHFATSSGFQDSARLPNGRMSGQLQMGPRSTGSGLHHPHTQLLQGMPPTQHIPGAPTMQMQMGPPSSHVGLQQTPNSNATQFVPPPLPGRGFPRGPPMQIGPGVLPAQGMHGSTQQLPMGTVSAAPGYQGEPRPPPMPPTATYGQWRPPPSAPNFAVAHSFPIDPSQMHSLPSAWPLQRVDDGAQRVSGSDEVKKNKEGNLSAGAEADPEPPVPGLSPKPPPPPPPGEGSTPMVWTEPSSQGCQESNEMSERGYYQAQWMPPHYMQGHGINQECYNSRDPYTRDGTWGYPSGEYWETPEGEGFREDVFALVSMRVHTHHKLRTRDLDRFCGKMADVIVRKEVAKYIEHRNQGIEKIIIKAKLIEKVDSYVDNQVGLYLKKIDKSHRG